MFQRNVGLFFTNGKVCGENNIVAGIERNVKGKSGLEKHKEQLKMLFFNPGQKIPGIPFIGDKVDIFDPSISKYYDFSIDLDEMNGQQCFIFKIIPKEDIDRDDIVFVVTAVGHRDAGRGRHSRNLHISIRKAGDRLTERYRKLDWADCGRVQLSTCLPEECGRSLYAKRSGAGDLDRGGSGAVFDGNRYVLVQAVDRKLLAIRRCAGRSQ